MVSGYSGVWEGFKLVLSLSRRCRDLAHVILPPPCALSLTAQAPPFSLHCMLDTGACKRRAMECGVIASLLWQRCAKDDMGMLAGYDLVSFVHVTHQGCC